MTTEDLSQLTDAELREKAKELKIQLHLECFYYRSYDRSCRV